MRMDRALQSAAREAKRSARMDTTGFPLNPNASRAMGIAVIPSSDGSRATTPMSR